MKRLAAILEILLKKAPDGYLTAYNDSISLAKGVGPENFTKHQLARLRGLNCKWLPWSERTKDGGYWITCW